jgi:hypothetical protein
VHLQFSYLFHRWERIPPVEFTRLIGQIAQVIIGVSVALIIFGLIGKKPS